MSWTAEPTGDTTWNSEPIGNNGDSWGGGGDEAGTGDTADGGDANDDRACRICNQTGHFARECPDKPAGGLTGECFNCGEVGHNKADCTNPRVQCPFAGTCKLCGNDGHRAIDCKERRLVDWAGVPEMSDRDAWTALIDAAQEKDLDVFRICLRAYARATGEQFSLPDVETALRDAELGVYLIAQKQELPANMTIVDLIGNSGREYVLTVQLSDKPRRVKLAQGWPENAVENIGRLHSSGYVQDIGVPVCNNCGELGHIRKSCPKEVIEVESNTPMVVCVNCKDTGHRARDCPKERFNPFACKNCKQEGHNSKECPEPRSAEGVECRKCNEKGHFSKDCPNVEKRTCRNCGSEDHMAKECDKPRNPANVTCRNCEKMGHFSRDCPEPKDWSKVQCSNCGEFGHTIKRCSKTTAEDDPTGSGGAVGGSGGWDIAGAGEAASGAGGEPSWDTNDTGTNAGW